MTEFCFIHNEDFFFNLAGVRPDEILPLFVWKIWFMREKGKFTPFEMQNYTFSDINDDEYLIL